MRDTVTVCPIQLPGREERINEIPYTSMENLLDDLEISVKKVLKGSFAIWGHSMGGKIGYELEKRMEQSGYISRCLFVSGSGIPSIPVDNPIYSLTDRLFKNR